MHQIISSLRKLLIVSGCLFNKDNRLFCYVPLPTTVAFVLLFSLLIYRYGIVQLLLKRLNFVLHYKMLNDM